ncbi:hypothetical protein Psfp_03891 [Pelotomaculum sp. FP]|nr:hypothetical protein Psfp_03891 [Pelotomaculum sp. FP]
MSKNNRLKEMSFIYTNNNHIKWSELINLKSKKTTINDQLILPVTFNGQEIFYCKQIPESLLIFMMHKYLSASKVYIPLRKNT